MYLSIAFKYNQEIKMIAITLLLTGLLSAQSLDSMTYNTVHTVITDSVVWSVDSIDASNLGDLGCEHIWERGAIKSFRFDFRCSAWHSGWHCNNDDNIRESICIKCLRHIYEREIWYQSEAPETNFEKLKRNLK